MLQMLHKIFRKKTFYKLYYNDYIITVKAYSTTELKERFEEIKNIIDNKQIMVFEKWESIEFKNQQTKIWFNI